MPEPTVLMLLALAGLGAGFVDAVVGGGGLIQLPAILLGLPGACRKAAVRLGLDTAIEAFADRAYAPDGTLVPRGRPGAVLTDPEAIAERVMRLATAGHVDTSEGLVAVKADSVCVHGDTPGAVAIARAVRTQGPLFRSHRALARAVSGTSAIETDAVRYEEDRDADGIPDEFQDPR